MKLLSLFLSSIFLVSNAKYIVTLKSNTEISLTNEEFKNKYEEFKIGNFHGAIVDDFTIFDPEIIEEVYDDKEITISRSVPDYWGLDRIDQKSFPGDNKYTSNITGEGIDVYILDTGVQADHIEFGDRVLKGATFVGGNEMIDVHGHGTHVASTVGGLNSGVANKVNIIPVKVMRDDGKGTWSEVIAGLNWVINNQKSRNRCSIINMSISSSKFSLGNNAVNAVFDEGISVVAAAGNTGTFACDNSPASAEKVITVGASTSNDFKAFFSSSGECMDLYAPGSLIKGADNNGGYITFSGTSMASPHTVGVMAQLFQKYGCGDLKFTNELLLNMTVKDKINGGLTNTPNRLLQAALFNPTVNRCINVCKNRIKQTGCLEKTPNCPCEWDFNNDFCFYRTKSPTKLPTNSPTKSPTKSPTEKETTFLPSKSPTLSPSMILTLVPTLSPTILPIKDCVSHCNKRQKNEKQCQRSNICTCVWRSGKCKKKTGT